MLRYPCKIVLMKDKSVERRQYMKKIVYESPVYATESKEIFPFKVCIEEETNSEIKTVKVLKSEYRTLVDNEMEKKLIVLNCSWKGSSEKP